MEENYYKERNIANKLPIILIVSIVALLIAVIAFFVVKGVRQEETFDIENEFLTIGKEYYQNSSNLPKEVGECNTVTLETLLSKNFIEKPEQYGECNKYNTKMKVCKLESNNYQYVPILICDSVNSEQQFSEWKVGNESNLVVDSSDVEFYFLGYKKVESEATNETFEKWEDEITIQNYQVLSTTTYYRYRDKEWLWQETSTEYYTKNDVGSSNLAYYATSPNSEYTNSDSQTTAYKWYTEKNVETEPKKMYVCKSSNGVANAYKQTPCSEATDGKTETVREFYTCGSLRDENGRLYYPEIPEGSVCDCSSDTYGKNCSIKRTYYPSGESEANRESVYYVSAPITGAIKDVSTKLNASRYYKDVVTTTSKYYTTSPSATAIKVGEGRWSGWSQYSTSKPKSYDNRQVEKRNKIKYQLPTSNTSDWEQLSSNYLSLDNFIIALKSSGYDMNSLTEINNNQNLKYDIQLKYRNRNN